MGSPPKAHAETTWTKLARVFLAAPARVMRPAWVQLVAPVHIVRPARVPYVGPVRCSGPLLQ